MQVSLRLDARTVRYTAVSQHISAEVGDSELRDENLHRARHARAPSPAALGYHALRRLAYALTLVRRDVAAAKHSKDVTARELAEGTAMVPPFSAASASEGACERGSGGAGEGAGKPSLSPHSAAQVGIPFSVSAWPKPSASLRWYPTVTVTGFSTPRAVLRLQVVVHDG